MKSSLTTLLRRDARQTRVIREDSFRQGDNTAVARYGAHRCKSNDRVVQLPRSHGWNSNEVGESFKSGGTAVHMESKHNAGDVIRYGLAKPAQCQ